MFHQPPHLMKSPKSSFFPLRPSLLWELHLLYLALSLLMAVAQILYGQESQSTERHARTSDWHSYNLDESADDEFEQVSELGPAVEAEQIFEETVAETPRFEEGLL